jgi:HemY protein
MLRLAFLLIIAVAAMLASWQIVTTDPGTVEVNWFGTEISTSALFGLLLLVVVIAVALPLLRLAMFLMDAPGRIGKASQRQRIRRGQEALALGLIAAEAGEFEDARRHADKAEDLIDEPRLALLLQARAAEVSGDTSGAERAYAGMLQNEDTEVLGRKGLMAAALKRGDRNAARACGGGAESLKDRLVAVSVRIRPRGAGRRLGKRDRVARSWRQAQIHRGQSRQAPPRRVDDGASAKAGARTPRR